MPPRSSPLLDNVRKNPAPAIAIHIPLRLIGMVLAGIIALMLLALSSWSVNDPSFSYATAKHPQNWLGFPGAVLADLGFQVFGLAIFAVLVPPALWAAMLIRRRLPSKMLLRVLAWVGMSLLSGGIFAFVDRVGSD